MRRVTFTEHDGRSQIIDAVDGQTLMQAATQNGVRGIIAECGGARVCGTCHCYIDEPWLNATGTACEDERMLLEFSENYRPNSRLSCQILVSAAIEGMVVHLPSSQP
ncbi:2Fe-2S iron-sulfur cluster-binding protein [Nevskia ramosa]|uniref:2Fe-2S iron-sulfur cluster-binding protein n=1 Tax=Nevskia ramosa TaxID=64002 RepID=UPI002353C26D|nr:2Fe-2S iron-sulfur cluster-binding protein [Nevskia ramosa]